MPRKPTHRWGLWLTLPAAPCYAPAGGFQTDLQATARQFNRTLADLEREASEPERLEIWVQDWPDTSCGHGGCGGQAFTAALVVAAVYTRPGDRMPRATGP